MRYALIWLGLIGWVLLNLYLDGCLFKDWQQQQAAAPLLRAQRQQAEQRAAQQAAQAAKRASWDKRLCLNQACREPGFNK